MTTIVDIILKDYVITSYSIHYTKLYDESFAEAFKEAFEPKLKGKIQTEYVYQELDDLPEGFSLPEGREKPWGTGHAILMAKDVINEPFAIINADDFYGREAFGQVVDFVENSPSENEYAMLGYALNNTLSEFGTVSRGVCETDDQSNLVNIVERTKIGLEGEKVFFYEEDGKTELSGREAVSMNFWAFKPSFFTVITSYSIHYTKLYDHIESVLMTLVVALPDLINLSATALK